jgi:hypothetical protein
MEFKRPVFWNKDCGTIVPFDILLGIESSSYSHGVCEICCRESLNTAFVPASSNIERLAQLEISSSTVRQIVEQQGHAVLLAIRKGALGPDFTAQDCSQGTLVVGSDGVMVPMVTEDQKQKRRQTEAKKRRKEKRPSTAKAARPRKGADGAYKEFKLVAFYDQDKQHQYVVGTNGDCTVAGRMMRQIARQVNLDQAQVKYSVSDGAVWIFNQFTRQLPMLDENILDYYHLREHVTQTSHVLFGEGTEEALSWKTKMMDFVKHQGSLVLLDRLGESLAGVSDDNGREALVSLREFLAKRIAMTDYPHFIAQGYDIGSGPTESFCGCLTQRLKGSGMRWNKDNAEAIMALAGLYFSHLWDNYWKSDNRAA